MPCSAPVAFRSRELEPNQGNTYVNSSFKKERAILGLPAPSRFRDVALRVASWITDVLWPGLSMAG